MRWFVPIVVFGLMAVGDPIAAEPADAHATAGPRPVAAHLAEARQWRERLGLATEYANVDGINTLKIAVLDYGFAGAESDRPYLPASAEVVEHYDPMFVRHYPELGDPAYQKPFEPGNRHGREMAQIVWAITGSDPRGPKFYLLNASGPTLLRRAVRYAIEQDVDIILFSGSFEGGGNGDGRGPINRIVDDALAAGIVWINAAGNFGRHVYNGPVRILREGYLRLGGGTDIAALRFRNRLDENNVTVTLTWNDYREQEDAGTTKDLDLYVEDWAGRRVGSGSLLQVSGDREAGPGETRNPRERVVLINLPASPDVADPDCAYRIRIRAKRGTFTANDRLRVLVTAEREAYLPPGGRVPAESIEFLDATREGEVYPPADHPLVLTVGAADETSSIGPTADRRVKPDVILDESRGYFTDGTTTAGSSNAAALFTGIVAVLKAAEPGLSRRDLLELARLGGSQSRHSSTVATARNSALQPSAHVTRTVAPSLRVQVGAGGVLVQGNGRTAIPSPPQPGPELASSPSAPALPEYLERRIWRTPTRAELSAAVQRGF